MYDRAPRQIAFYAGNTLDHVGPGTYDADVANSKRTRADGYAPFQSMVSRDNFLNPNDQLIAAPGPGQYDPSIQGSRVQGGRALANKSKRFGKDAMETPGPGAYTIGCKKDWIREASKRQTQSAPVVDSSEKPRGGNLMTNRIRFHRKPMAPAIPTPGQAYGYEENEDGSLRKQAPPNKDSSLGPAYYQIEHKDATPTVLYKGVHFGKQSSRRMGFGGKDGPGPGEYEPYKPPENYVDHLNMDAESARHESHLPRYHEIVVRDEEKKCVPGPGKYNIRGAFDKDTPKINTEGIEVEHPPFLSQAKVKKDADSIHSGSMLGGEGSVVLFAVHSVLY